MTLQRYSLVALILISLSIRSQAQNTDSIILRRFFTNALQHDSAYANLHDICKQCGARLSGSEGAAKAVQLVCKQLAALGADSVWLQPVMVPHWVRGDKEQASIISKSLKINESVPVCALGGSVGTGKNGLNAEVIEVHGLEHLQNMNPADIKGKIVFYNEPFDQTFTSTFNAYGKAVAQRWGGAMEAAKYGAVGVVVRSMAQHVDDWPHTGSMGYSDTIPKIPAVAISSRAAEELSESLAKDKQLTFSFKTTCETLPDAESFNVIGEIKGTEKGNEIILVGGHLDSWDLSESAQDDGAGVVQSMEVLRLFKLLGLRPKHTIRMIAFMNEENGLRGGKNMLNGLRQMAKNI